MKKVFLLLELLCAYRLLKPKLKENEDLYLTNVNSKLKLAPLQENRESQRISIHKRKISFNEHILSLDTDSLEIKLKKEKTVTYLKRSKMNGKKSDPFGFKKKNRPNPEESPKDKIKQIRTNKQTEMKTNTSFKDTNIRDLKNRNEPLKPRIARRPEITKNYDPTTSKNYDPTTTKNYAPATTKNYEPEDGEEERQEVDPVYEKLETDPPDTNNIDMESILSKVKHLLIEKKSYLIESDSKIEEDTVKYKKIDIFIHPLNDKYIKLKTPEKDCITYFKDSFIFTPCLNVDNQVFKLENEEEILKKIKTAVEDDEDSDVSDTNTLIKRRKNNPPLKSEVIHENKQEPLYVSHDYRKEVPHANENPRTANKSYRDDSPYKLDKFSDHNYKINSTDKESQRPENYNLNRKPYQNSNYDLNRKPYSNYDKPVYELPFEKKKSPYETFFSKPYKTVEPKQAKEYTPPSSYNSNPSTYNSNPSSFKSRPAIISPPVVSKLPATTKEAPKISSDSDSTLSKLMTPDDFLQKIKNSVNMPDLEELI